VADASRLLVSCQIISIYHYHAANGCETESPIAAIALQCKTLRGCASVSFSSPSTISVSPQRVFLRLFAAVVKRHNLRRVLWAQTHGHTHTDLLYLVDGVPSLLCLRLTISIRGNNLLGLGYTVCRQKASRYSCVCISQNRLMYYINVAVIIRNGWFQQRKNWIFILADNVAMTCTFDFLQLQRVLGKRHTRSPGEHLLRVPAGAQTRIVRSSDLRLSRPPPGRGPCSG